MTRRKQSRQRPHYPRPVSTFNMDQVRVLNTVDRDTVTDAAAARYMLRNGAADLLDMLGLTNE